jgi:branched-chain amino acid aminotransferase
MINVSRGPLGIYAHLFEGGPKCTVVIADFPLKWTVRGMGKLFDVGINAVIPSQRAIPGWLLDPKIKNRSRLFYQMANIEVSAYRGENNWALLLDPDGFIAEGTGDNFFIVKDGCIITPEGRNVLRGISRAYVFELSEGLGYPCIEKNIEPYDVYTADEAFMTGTPFCLLPVTSLNGVKIDNGTMGPVTKALLEKWGKNVGLDIIAQIKKFNQEFDEANPNAPTPYRFVP